MTDPATSRPIRQIAVVGGGAAGWMCAAAITKKFNGTVDVVLVESEEIGLIGVGEATVPHLSAFNALLEIDEAEFVRETQGSFKLGIQFNDWGRIGDSYVHGFGTIGRDVGLLPFHQYWLKARAAGRAEDISAYSLNTVAAPLGKFMAAPSDAPPNSPLAEIAYAYHFDAVLYARYLRRRAEAQGARRIEGKVIAVHRHGESGFVESVELESGARIGADLFLDCTGFRSLLLGDALGVGFEDWSHWLPCDRALAVPCEKIGPPTPYTRSTAREAGWQWRIPLQHRTGNGHVYSSAFTSDDRAAEILLGSLDGKAQADPKPLRFTTGKRAKMWDRNVIAIGLAGGFLEPLESTAIYLIQAGINRLMSLFPDADCDPALQAVYNEQTAFEYERIRDFLILHYHVTQRDDSAFWNYVRTMPIPDTLQRYIDLFAANGQFFRNATEMFGITSWVQVMLGQGLYPRAYHPAVDWVPEKDVQALVDYVGKVVASNVALMPAHEQFIARCCAAPAKSKPSAPAAPPASDDRQRAVLPNTRVERFGREGHPVVTIDGVSGRAGDLVDLAAGMAPFPPAPHFYPGVRRAFGTSDAAAMRYAEALVRRIAPQITATFGSDRLELIEASFSIVTARPDDLAPPQRAPHFDTTDPGYLAILHYIAGIDGSGTAFFRHRQTGFEAVTAQNRGTFLGSTGVETPDVGYVGGANAHYEEIGRVEARPDRLVIYQGRLLHSGIIPPDMPLDPDPRRGRLTANLFVQLK